MPALPNGIVGAFRVLSILIDPDYRSDCRGIKTIGDQLVFHRIYFSLTFLGIGKLAIYF